MVAAGVAAPELAGAIAPELMGAGGMGAAAMGAATGAGLSGLTAAATGQNALRAAEMGALGGAATGFMPDVASGGIDSLGAVSDVTPVTEGAPIASETGNIATNTSGEMLTPQGAVINPQATPTTMGNTQDIADMSAGPSAGRVPTATGVNANTYMPNAPSSTSNMLGNTNVFSNAGTLPSNAQLYTSAGINALGASAARPAGAYTPSGAIYTGGPLQKFKYDPNNYQPDVVTPPNPVYHAQYAQGGITSLATGGTGKDALKDLLSSRDAMDQYESQYQSDPTAVAGKAQGGDYNAMLALNKLRGTPNANYAGGGISTLGSYSDGGRLLKGPGDGMSDSIPAKIGKKQEARLAEGEFVVPADVVSGLGNGSTDAGAKHLYKMMDKVRHARTGRKSQGKQIAAEKYIPA
jgi:hypothetical protein